MAVARLEVIDSAGRRVVPIDKPMFKIGRRNTSDLCIASQDVSREHAEIVRDNGRHVLRDRSSNGTFVNDNAVSEHTLTHGDRIRLGRSEDAKLVFLQDEGSASSDTHTSSAVHDLRQMAALFEGLRAMGSAHALDEVLALVLDMTLEFTGAERGFIMLADLEGQLEFTLARAQGRVTLPGKTFDTSRRIPEEVFATGRARTVNDLLDANIPAGNHEGTIALGIRHVLCLPLQLARFAQKGDDAARGPKRIGVLYLDSRKRGTLLSETTQGGLETLASEAAVAIENARLYREEVEKLRLEQELNIAAQMQQALLPQSRYVGKGFEAVAVSVPCRAIGGDFYDYVELTDNRGFGFALGDVAGKGPPAALLTAVVQGVFSTRASEGESPARTVSQVNQAVIRRAVRARFVTMMYGLVSPDGQLTYCNAGHNPPLLIGKTGVRRLECGGLVLGLFADAEYQEETLSLEPGDIIVVFSDGVSESMDVAGEQYEENRIAECVQRHKDLEPEMILEQLLADVRRFSEGTPQHDDLTAMIFRYDGQQGA